MSIPIFHVDAFAEKPFAGNPAAVCLLPAWRDDAWLQAVAREMNLSETAFVVGPSNPFELRWFTPTTEVLLCGHATLAAAHVLWQTEVAGQENAIRFQTKSGLLGAARHAEGIQLDFPSEPAEPAEAPPALVEGLGGPLRYVGRNRMDFLAEVDSEDTLRRLAPGLRRLATLPARGVIVTSRSLDPRYDFVSRFFAPAAGVDEDPVTGSAHCCLGPFWRERLGKTELRAYQASPRGGSCGCGSTGIAFFFVVRP